MPRDSWWRVALVEGLVYLAMLVVAALMFWAIWASLANAQAIPEPAYRQLIDRALSCHPFAPVKPRKQWLAELAAQYAEHPVATAYISPTAVVELLVSPIGATWTILRSNPLKQACVAASGQYQFADTEPSV